MATLDDLNKAVSDVQAADTAIQTAVADAITLIKSLHSGGGGSVTDAQVEAAVSALEVAAGDFSTASGNLAAAKPGS